MNIIYYKKVMIELIDGFMQWKHKSFIELCYPSRIAFYGREDRKEVLALSYSRLLRIFKSFEHELFYTAFSTEPSIYNFNSGFLCPFCIVHKYCYKCTFANRHGSCLDSKSDYNFIHRTIKKRHDVNWFTYLHKEITTQLCDIFDRLENENLHTCTVSKRRRNNLRK